MCLDQRSNNPFSHPVPPTKPTSPDRLVHRLSDRRSLGVIQLNRLILDAAVVVVSTGLDHAAGQVADELVILVAVMDWAARVHRFAVGNQGRRSLECTGASGTSTTRSAPPYPAEDTTYWKPGIES